VYYASRQLREQATFRATLSTLWLVLNTVLLIGFWSGAQLDSEIFKMTAFVLPGLIVGIVLGSFIRVNELIFRGITYALLLLSGLVLLV
jgi:hypothetical protein